MTYDAQTPLPGYGYSTPVQPAPDHRMPGIGAAAAVLGFVEAGLGLTLVAYVLFTFATLGAGADDGGAVAVLVGVIVISGLTLLGSLFLARRSGRRLLIGATIAEIVIVLGLGVWAVADYSSVMASPVYYDYQGSPSNSGPDTAVVVALLAVLMVGFAMPVVRLALVAQPTVGTWLQNRPPAAPVWSAENQQWVAPRSGAGVVVALMAPVALLLVATVVVLANAEDQFDYYGATDTPAGVYGTDSEWSSLYDGGDPVQPPSSSDPFYESQYDADAQDCYDGDLGACDDLYSETEVGSLYEWLGSTCGGRQESETYGTCE
ncbi:hypothetical protein SAMN05660199_02899 [Klenkia soli]|uniref:Uncharacterized protein n=1 Tax=Klenkia soli TaxID=1052260 RepID=A0A1H0NX47_9ACTN|nr:hypothetical protein [Klenkia soli]SDO97357.1 hypothetical protein SAMN05660199_02899 [Klenkia soli]